MKHASTIMSGWGTSSLACAHCGRPMRTDARFHAQRTRLVKLRRGVCRVGNEWRVMSEQLVRQVHWCGSVLSNYYPVAFAAPHSPVEDEARGDTVGDGVDEGLQMLRQHVKTDD